MEKEQTPVTKMWETILAEMRHAVSEANFGTLFKKTVLLSLDDDIATIAAPSTMVLDLLQKRFTQVIQQRLRELSGHDISVLFIVKTIPSKTKTDKEAGPLFSTTVQTAQPVKPFVGHLPRVRADFTFENFAVSGSNQLAFVSAQKVAEKIGHAYNPLFIYGPVGVGKTHLMHAIANTSYQQNPEKRIIYITSEEFTNEVVEAIRNNDTARMKKKFRSAYILIIDDIQFIEGKEKVQEELFHTFNILIDNASQICLTSDRPPHEIKKLEKRLSSRFAGGLTVDIGKPDLELKSAILQKKAEKMGQPIETEVALFLAAYAEDTRSLEGLLIRVITQANTAHLPITKTFAEQVMDDIAHEEKKEQQKIHPDEVITYVCEYFRVKPTQLRGPKREASLVRARQVAMYVLYEELKITYGEIGNLLGGRDHTTIMHGVEKMKFLVDNKDKVHEDILGITKYFRG